MTTNTAITDSIVASVFDALRHAGVPVMLRRIEINPTNKENAEIVPGGFDAFKSTKSDYWIILPSEAFIRFNWCVFVYDDGSKIIVHSKGTSEPNEGAKTVIVEYDDPAYCTKVVEAVKNLPYSEPSAMLTSMLMSFEDMLQAAMAKESGKPLPDHAADKVKLTWGTGVKAVKLPGKPEKLHKIGADLKLIDDGVTYTEFTIAFKRNPTAVIDQYPALFEAKVRPLDAIKAAQAALKTNAPEK